MRGYSLFSILQILLYLIFTKLFYSNARLIRLPFFIKGRKFINIGDRFNSGRYCRLEAMPQSADKKIIISIGGDVEINDFVHIAGIDAISIGNNVLIASRVFISDHNHGSYTGLNQSNPSSIVKQRPLSSNKVCIDDNVWIGEGCAILPGVHIGKNSIIGSNSVVTCDVPENSIAAGIPAKIIKSFNSSTNTWDKYCA